MQVILLPEVFGYLEDLSELLYEKGYFSFGNTARKYVLELYDEIIADLPTKPHKPAPAYFDRYGKKMKYASFRKSRHTTWYVFFKTYTRDGEIFYLVRYVANNHTAAQYL